MKPSMRLDRMLARLGFGTRNEIRQLVRQGAVTVNGETASDPGRHVRPQTDEIRVRGEPVTFREHVYVMMHKPAGVVSATEDLRERTVLDLLPDHLRGFHPFPIGRLDKDAEGLLLLTSNGKLAHELLSPRRHVPKTYRALVRGEVGPDDVAAFAAGVTLDDGYVTMPARLTVLAAVSSAVAAEAGIGTAADRCGMPDGSSGEAGGRRAISAASGGGGTTPGEPGGGGTIPEEMRQAIARLASEPVLKRDAWEQALRDGAPLSWIELTICEGKFHQVKRMFGAVGKPVLYLRRVAMGPLRLDAALRPGEWRELTPEEERALLNGPPAESG